MSTDRLCEYRPFVGIQTVLFESLTASQTQETNPSAWVPLYAALHGSALYLVVRDPLLPTE